MVLWVRDIEKSLARRVACASSAARSTPEIAHAPLPPLQYLAGNRAGEASVGTSSPPLIFLTLSGRTIAFRAHQYSLTGTHTTEREPTTYSARWASDRPFAKTRVEPAATHERTRRAPTNASYGSSYVPSTPIPVQRPTADQSLVLQV